MFFLPTCPSEETNEVRVSGDQCDQCSVTMLLVTMSRVSVQVFSLSSANYHLWCPVSPDALLIVIINNYAEIAMQ